MGMIRRTAAMGLVLGGWWISAGPLVHENRDCKRGLHSPSQFEAGGDSPIWNLQDFTPFRHAVRFSLKRQHFVAGSVSALLDSVGPSYISQNVAKFVFDPIEGESIGTITNM